MSWFFIRTLQAEQQRKQLEDDAREALLQKQALAAAIQAQNSSAVSGLFSSAAAELSSLSKGSATVKVR